MISGYILGLITSGFFFFMCHKNLLKMIKNKEQKAKKFENYCFLLQQWIDLKIERKKYDTWFEENNIKEIAIYGMGGIGKLFYKELINSNIKVNYAIDRNSKIVIEGLEIKSINEELKMVDAIIVSAMADFEQIEKKLRKKLDCPIISLEDIILEI